MMITRLRQKAIHFNNNGSIDNSKEEMIKQMETNEKENSFITIKDHKGNSDNHSDEAILLKINLEE